MPSPSTLLPDSSTMAGSSSAPLAPLMLVTDVSLTGDARTRRGSGQAVTAGSIAALLVGPTTVLAEDQTGSSRAGTAPNHLPADVLVIIFSLLPFRSRIVCGVVCRLWRNTALSLTVLWTTPRFDTNPMRRGTRHLLARSGEALIDLHIQQRPPTYYASDPAIKRLGAHSNRVRTLTICPPAPPRDPHPLIAFTVAARPRPQRGPDDITYVHIPAMLNLHTLHVGWDDTRMVLSLMDDTLEQDQAQLPGNMALQEVVILRGVRGIDFLGSCRHLRILALRAPQHLDPLVALDIIRNNPHLQRLELVFPISQRSVTIQPGALNWNANPVPTNLEHVLMGEYSKPKERQLLNRNPTPVVHVHFLTAMLDCLQIQEIEWNAHVTQLDRNLIVRALNSMQDITVFDVYDRDAIRMHDLQGRTRCFSAGIAGGRVLLEFFARISPDLRALRLSVGEWRLLRRAGNPRQLGVLEELYINCQSGVDDDDCRQHVLCPRPRVLTLSLPRWDFFLNKIAVPAAIEFAQLLAANSSALRLGQLNLLGMNLQPGSYTFPGSQPETVFVGKADAVRFPTDDQLTANSFEWSTSACLSRP